MRQEQKTNDDDSGNVTNVATKAQLQAAVKTLGMGPSAFKGLSKEPDAYCSELQARILAFIEKSSGEKHKALPTPEELAELKKAAEAKKELSFLDASSIIEAIKRDIARDLEREAAQAASEPQQKKAKVEKEAGTRASAAPAAGSGAGKRGGDAEEKQEEEEDEDAEDSEDSDEDEDGSEDSEGDSEEDSDGSDSSEEDAAEEDEDKEE
ncbi:glutamic acid-rich protein-like [Cyclospora cayetanensis]|uniref:Glutamic acid-rich protein-like n=1 Tax=Cyclospora cayetanensis TaxID=88456 RepID=A0A6P6S025_9EIME|nr:glutamic acid-rich protein-like [Cyclospora cayetanensis]